MHIADSQDVCLSITRRYYIETAKHIINCFFLPSGSHTILVLSYQTVWQHSDRDSPNVGRRMQWV